jgi:hypothetical protein
MDWPRVLAYVTGTVDQELLLRNKYPAAENRILKTQLTGRLRLSDADQATLGEIAHRLGRRILGEVANVARSDTTGLGPEACRPQNSMAQRHVEVRGRPPEGTWIQPD